VLVDRQGGVDKVVVGDAHRVFLPDLGARRAGAARFRGLRLIHTSLRPDGLSEDDLTDLALLQLDAVITIRVQPDGLPGGVQYAYLLPPDSGSGKVSRTEEVRSVFDWEDDWTAFITDLEGQFARSAQLTEIEDREGAILVGLTLRDPRRARRSLDELVRLCDTAGLKVLDVILARRDALDGRTCVGEGKLQELIVRSMHLGAKVLIFDRELSPSQLRNIAEKTDLKVLDRTQLILDIFAQHATTREGKLQVELAQLRYRLPRLKIMPTAMSRLTGGIGGRGPGETKLEMNRRHAQDIITKIERQLDDIATHRAVRRSKRQKAGVPVASIVGYTNAGKSTLLNKITSSAVLAEDKLFATLDTTSRRFRLPEEREILLTDTVGFIHDLPETLVQAFKATLEELEEADLLVHVLDAADADVEHHKRDVEAIVDQLGLAERPTLLVWNKADAAAPDRLRDLIERYGGISASALSGEGTDRLLEEVERVLFRSRAAARTAAIEGAHDA
jgi:GTP-binding protein HflX